MKFILLAGLVMTSPFAVAKTLIFGKDVVAVKLSPASEQAPPSAGDFYFKVDERPIIKSDRLTLTGSIENEESKPKVVVVMAGPDGNPLGAMLSNSSFVRVVQPIEPPELQPYSISIPARSKLQFSRQISLKHYAYVGRPEAYVKYSFGTDEWLTNINATSISARLPARPDKTVFIGQWRKFVSRHQKKQACSPEAGSANTIRISMPKEIWLKRGEPLPICITANLTSEPDSVLILVATAIDGPEYRAAQHIDLAAGPTTWVHPDVSDHDLEPGMNVSYANEARSEPARNPLAKKGVSYMSYDLNEFRDGVVSIFENYPDGEGRPRVFEVSATLGKLKAPPIRVSFGGHAPPNGD